MPKSKSNGSKFDPDRVRDIAGLVGAVALTGGALSFLAKRRGDHERWMKKQDERKWNFRRKFYNSRFGPGVDFGHGHVYHPVSDPNPNVPLTDEQKRGMDIGMNKMVEHAYTTGLVRQIRRTRRKSKRRKSKSRTRRTRRK